MNSRERILKCIRHEPIDRVPISTTYILTGWADNAWYNKEPSYQKFMEYTRRYADCIYMVGRGFKIMPNPIMEVQKWQEGTSYFARRIYHTGNGDLVSLHRTDEGVYTQWTLKHLLEDISDIKRYLSLPYEPPELDMTAFYGVQEKLGDKGVMMISGSDPICLAADLFEMSKFLFFAVTESEKIKYFLDAIHERQMFDLRRILKNDVKDVIFLINGPEYATPPYLSPDYFHEYVTCYLIDICKEIKLAGGIPWIHCHGKIAKIINQIALTDAEVLDPLEPPPDGDMELADIKRLYGKKFCLFGNIEFRELEYSDTRRIDFLVKSAMNAAKEGSGFVLMPTTAPINVPLSAKTEENYIQMIESALEYGKY